MGKEYNTDESDFSENEMSDLNSFETFWIWTKNKHRRYWEMTMKKVLNIK